MPRATSTSTDLLSLRSILARVLRRPAGFLGCSCLLLMLLACIASLPWTLAPGSSATPRYNEGAPAQGLLPPAWVSLDAEEADRAQSLPSRPLLGTDLLGRSLLTRLLTGGGISLLVGICAAAISVIIGTAYGALAGVVGGRTDALMMRAVDVLYGLPYVLLVVLLAVASDALVSEYVSRQKTQAAWVRTAAAEVLRTEGLPATPHDARERLDKDAALRDSLSARAALLYPPRDVSANTRTLLDLSTLLIAIGGVSWLTMARVIRGQVLSLRERPFIEAARALGQSSTRTFFRHLLPNLVGPITVYATLTVPQAILQESFLSFLGIGVRPPLPSWGNLAAEGLPELNTYQSHWWLLVFPCAALACTLLALNFVGEALREAIDPKAT